MRYLKLLFIWSMLLFVYSCSNDADDFSDISNDTGMEEPNGTIRYNSIVFSNLTVTENIIYGNNTTQGGVSQDLVMDLYEPEGDVDNNRNLVILAHGGGFVGGDKASFEDLARYLAQSGYVVASINYRLLDEVLTQASIKQAVIEAVFDMKAAVRFFKHDAATANLYKINPSTIFIGGYSAGAFMGLHYAYVTSDNEIIDIGGTTLLNYVNANGGIDGNSGNAGYNTSVKGVLNIAGALLKASHVDANEPVLYSVHGTDDTVVPYLSGNADNTGVITEGSGLIHPVAESVGIGNTLKTIQNGDHGAFSSCNSCPAELRNFIFQYL